MRKLMTEGDEFTVKDTDLGIPDADPDITYRVRSLTREVFKRLQRQHTKSVTNPKTRSLDEKTDLEALGESALDYVIVSWTGWMNGAGPAECTRDAKLRLDAARAAAILEQAGMSRVAGEGDHTESFRGPS